MRRKDIKVKLQMHRNSVTTDVCYIVRQFTGAVTVFNPISGKDDLRIGDVLNEKQAIHLASHYITTTVGQS